MRATGRPTFVGGNLGEPLAEAVGTPAGGAGRRLRRRGVQLPARDGRRRFHPRVAVLLNITARSPRSLRRTSTRYAAAKARIFAAQTARRLRGGERRRSAGGRAPARASRSRRVGFSIERALTEGGWRRRRRAGRCALPGDAPRALPDATCPRWWAAAQPGQRAGGAAREPPAPARRTPRRARRCSAFRPLAHRMELVAEARRRRLLRRLEGHQRRRGRRGAGRVSRGRSC